MRSSFLALVLFLATGLSACDDGAPPETVCAPGPLHRAEGPARLRTGVEHVIHISVDGLRPDALDVTPLAAFERLRTEGATTDNARPDVDSRFTLPNHTTQLTGRGVFGDLGHNWTVNLDPDLGITLHSNKGSYVASVFDRVHDAGLGTAAYVSKSKFSLFDTSYDAEHGAPDRTGADDGPDKVDTFVFRLNTAQLVDRVIADLATPASYSFVHLRDPDSAGHETGWDLTPDSPYLRAVARADTLVGRILDAVEVSPVLAGRTTVVLTADHGGIGVSHGDEVPEAFTIPFYVWGGGAFPDDLYALNPDRENPGRANVGYAASAQPIRNGDAGNLSLALLGLPSIAGSTIGAAMPLSVGVATGTEAPPGCGPSGR